MSLDKVRVYVPDGNTNAAEIEINGERPPISRLEVTLEPDAIPTIKVQLCPRELDMTLEAEPVYTLDPFTEEAHKAREIPNDRKRSEPVITKVVREVAVRGMASAVAEQVFDRIKNAGGKTFMHSLKIVSLELADGKGYDPYNRCPV